MKEKGKVLTVIRRAIALSLAAVIIFSLAGPVQVQAKTINVRSHSEEMIESYAKKYATAVKKGTYTLKFKKMAGSYYRGYLMFKAPKKGNYSFTLSNLKTNNKKQVSGWMACCKSEYGALYYANLKTQGGVRDQLKVNDRKIAIMPDYLKSRTGKLSLNKNETVYLYFQFIGSSGCGKTMTTKFVIK